VRATLVTAELLRHRPAAEAEPSEPAAEAEPPEEGAGPAGEPAAGPAGV
jgi:hypothetical protein